MAKSPEEKLATARAWKARNVERVKLRRHEYYLKHKAVGLSQTMVWRELHSEEVRRSKAAWASAHPGYQKAYRVKSTSKTKRNDRERLRYATDPAYRIQRRLRASLTQALKLQGTKKTHSISLLVGCTLEALRTHLEVQFEPGMSWGPNVHIDHIRPCSSFDLALPKDQKECFHYSNLRPLWAYDNLQKSDRWNEDSVDLE